MPIMPTLNADCHLFYIVFDQALIFWEDKVCNIVYTWLLIFSAKGECTQPDVNAALCSCVAEV